MRFKNLSRVLLLVKRGYSFPKRAMTDGNTREKTKILPRLDINSYINFILSSFT